MKPPICKLCGRRFRRELEDGQGGLVRFERADDHQPLDDHETGHPDNVACPEHEDAARELSNLTLPEAMQRPS